MLHRSIVRSTLCFVMLVLGTAPGHAQDLEVSAPLATFDFASDSSALGSDAGSQLASVAAWAHDHPWRLVLIRGYADPTGHPAANLRLSQNRADVVRDQLIALGVARERIVSAAYGQMVPDATRRVDVFGTAWDFRPLLENQRRGTTNASRPKRDEP
jgi:hypothetical protein